MQESDSSVRSLGLATEGAGPGLVVGIDQCTPRSVKRDLRFHSSALMRYRPLGEF